MSELAIQPSPITRTEVFEESEVQGTLSGKEGKQYTLTPQDVTNYFSILILFIEVMKLSLKGWEQERISRREERALQLENLQNMVDNLKQQGKSTRFACLSAGALATLSGLTPIVGHVAGDQILRVIKIFSTKLGEMEKAKFIESVMKTTSAMAETQKSYGQVQKTFAESDFVRFQHRSEIHKIDEQELSATMREIIEDRKSCERLLHEVLQMYHDATRQLYNS